MVPSFFPEGQMSGKEVWYRQMVHCDLMLKEEHMSLQRLRKKGTMVSGMLVLLIHPLGFVAESYSAQNLRTDGEIQGAVLKRLGMYSRIDSNNLGVNVEDGHVKIFGMVDSLKEKHVASQLWVQQ
jgi:hypothetical protein